MSNPVLIQALQTAGIANAENYRLVAGVTLAGDPVLQDGVWVVPVANTQTMSSQTVELASIIRPVKETFQTPSVFRKVAATSVEPVLCSMPEDADHDYTLDACFNPTTEEGRGELLRQAASSDKAQREQARVTIAQVLHKGDEGLKQELLEDLEDLAQNDPVAAELARQTYAEAHSSLPPQGGSASPSSGERAAPSAVPSSSSTTGAIPLAGGSFEATPVKTDGVIEMAAALSAPLSFDSLVPLAPLNTSTSGIRGDESLIAQDLPLISTTASASPSWEPFSLVVPVFQSAEALGRMLAPARETDFFRSLFGTQVFSPSTPALMQMLVEPTPEFEPMLPRVRHAVMEAVRTYRVDRGDELIGSPLDASRFVSLNFGYDPERRRIEISLVPVVSGRPVVVRPAVETGDDEESPFARFRSFGASLALSRLGRDGIFRDSDRGGGTITVFVPVPHQYFGGGRPLGEASFATRADGRATDRGVERLVRREAADDQHGGSHSEERRDRNSHGGGGRDRQHREDQEAYPQDGSEPLVA